MSVVTFSEGPRHVTNYCYAGIVQTLSKTDIHLRRLRKAHVKPSSIFGGLVLLLAVFIEGVLFQHYFVKHVEPFYPVNVDQVVTYLYSYWAHYQILERGPSVFADSYFWHLADPMKGPGLNYLATIATFIGGPHRFSIGVLNLVFLIVGQFALYAYLVRKDGTGAALLGSGLFLLAGTHFLEFGGINDMRRDYLCMIVAGITFFAVVEWLVSGTKKNYLLAFLALFGVSIMRSVALYYWSGAFALTLIVAFLLRVSGLVGTAGKLLTRSGVLLATSVSLIASNLIVNYSDFWYYYLAHKVDGEEAMRWTEFGVHNHWERLTYYPTSFFFQFSSLLIFAGIIALCVLVIGILTKPLASKEFFDRVKLAFARDASLSLSLLMFAALTTSSMVLLTYYSPNPVVIGFLAMILCVCVTRALSIVSGELDCKLVIIGGSLLVSVGVWNFYEHVKSASFRPHQSEKQAIVVNNALSQLKELVQFRKNQKTTLYWALVHDGLNDRNFAVFWYEQCRKAFPKTVQHIQVHYFPATDWTKAAEDLEKADIVVIPIYMTPLNADGFEYVGNSSVRQLLPKFKAELSKNFKRVSTYKLEKPAWEVAIFERVKSK